MPLCDWPVSYAAARDCELDESATEEEIERRARLEEMATEFLWNWTGRRLGLCEVTVAPAVEEDTCCVARATTFWGRGPYPASARSYGRLGGTVGFSWGARGRSCDACGHVASPNEVILPGRVHEVIEVKVGDDVLSDDAYHVENHRYLVRTDGEIWPAGDDSWTVRYLQGTLVPEGGQVAAGLLACEMSKAAENDRTCSLPQRIQNITRQGVSVGVAIDTFEDVEMGRTGIWLVDSWVASMMKPLRATIIRSPDYRGRERAREVTWQA